MAQVVVAREDCGSGKRLAEGGIDECAYFANATTLAELEAMIRVPADLAGVEAEVFMLQETLAAAA